MLIGLCGQVPEYYAVAYYILCPFWVFASEVGYLVQKTNSRKVLLFCLVTDVLQVIQMSVIF